MNRQQIYYQDHLEKYKEYRKNYYEQNRDNILQKLSEKYQNEEKKFKCSACEYATKKKNDLYRHTYTQHIRKMI